MEQRDFASNHPSFLRESICAVCGHGALRLLPQTPAATAGHTVFTGSGVFTAYIDIEIVSCFMLFSILGVRLKGRSAIWSGQIVGELILILPS